MKPNSGSVESATKPSSRPRSDRLAVTAGEPAGIGPDLCLELVASRHAGRIVVIGDIELLRDRARRLGKDVSLLEFDPAEQPGDGELAVLHTALARLPEPGRPDPANAAALLDTLKTAVAGCQSGDFAAMVTAPLHKGVINDGGIPFTGHTEYLAELTNSSLPVMLLVCDGLRVALATTHLPLREVPDRLTTALLAEIVSCLHDELRRVFRIESPRIVVCGLNPHAGEGGHLGAEDDAIIRPAVQQLEAAGIDVIGPLPADTAFTPAAGPKDAVLAMYHDQGLPVIKYAGFGNAVNVTLGLPIIRTSVDHGTAFDIAGSGKADAGSLHAAVDLAADLAG